HDGAARPEPPLALGRLDDRRPDAVLHRPARVHELRLPVHRGAEAGDDCAEPHEGRPADDVEDAVVRALVAGHGGSLRVRQGAGVAAESDGRSKRTGRRTHTLTESAPRTAGEKRRSLAPSTAAESKAACPLERSTPTESTTPVSVTK